MGDQFLKLNVEVTEKVTFQKVKDKEHSSLSVLSVLLQISLLCYKLGPSINKNTPHRTIREIHIFKKHDEISPHNH